MSSLSTTLPRIAWSILAVNQADGAADAAVMTKQTGGTDSSKKLSIAISCVGRRLVLGERTEEELTVRQWPLRPP